MSVHKLKDKSHCNYFTWSKYLFISTTCRTLSCKIWCCISCNLCTSVIKCMECGIMWTGGVNLMAMLLNAFMECKMSADAFGFTVAPILTIHSLPYHPIDRTAKQLSKTIITRLDQITNEMFCVCAMLLYQSFMYCDNKITQKYFMSANSHSIFLSHTLYLSWRVHVQCAWWRLYGENVQFINHKNVEVLWHASENNGITKHKHAVAHRPKHENSLPLSLSLS